MGVYHGQRGLEPGRHEAELTRNRSNADGTRPVMGSIPMQVMVVERCGVVQARGAAITKQFKMGELTPK